MGAECTSSVDEVPPCSDSSPLVLDRLPRVSERHERRDPDFSFQDSQVRTSAASSQQVASKAGDGDEPLPRLEAEGLHALQVQL